MGESEINFRLFFFAFLFIFGVVIIYPVFGLV